VPRSRLDEKEYFSKSRRRKQAKLRANTEDLFSAAAFRLAHDFVTPMFFATIDPASSPLID